jgi:hypothetical protein
VTTKVIRRVASVNGAPGTGLAPTWACRFLNDDGPAGQAAAPDPPVEIGSSGIYKVAITLGSGDRFDGIIQWGGADLEYEFVSVDFADSTVVVDTAAIADAVWDEILSGHTTAGSAGALLTSAATARLVQAIATSVAQTGQPVTTTIQIDSVQIACTVERIE